MTIEELEKIKSVFDAVMAGVAPSPHVIREAHDLLPNKVSVTNPPAMIRAINRFMMLQYHDFVKEAVSVKVEAEPITEAIGTMENKPLQSHKEASDDLLSFLTEAEQNDLKQPLAGTVLQKKTATKVIATKRKPRQPVTKNLNNTK